MARQRDKKGTRYKLLFKDKVCKEYQTGKYTKTELEEKYGLGHGRVLYWLEELGYGHNKALPLRR